MVIRRYKKGVVPFNGPRVVLVVFFAFTAVALVGYGTFGRHPELLAGRPALASFYGTAFTFFAQAHVVLAALVLGYYLIREAGASWLLSLVLVYAATLLSEVVGTSTGLPFGSYSYSGLLGWKWFGLVPFLIPLSWFLMAFPAYVLARRRFPNRNHALQRILLGAALLTAWDLALDPAMSGATNYWTWGEQGPYYGMPLMNLVGWMVTGVVVMALILTATDARWLDRLSVRWNAAYYGLTILMPFGMLVAAGMWTGAAVALAVPAVLVAYALMGVRSGDARSAADEQYGGDERSAADEQSVGDERSAAGRHSGHPAGSEVQAPDYRNAPAYVRYRAAAVGETAAPLEFFAHHSRSFSFAARLFSEHERRLIAGLYAFCRTTDDLVDRRSDDTEDAVKEDDVDDAILAERLVAWRTLAHQAYESGDTGIAWLDGIMTESAARHVPFALACELIEGVRMDLQKVRIKTWEELDLYMYRVASVVGIWMCYLFGVTDRVSHRRAAALGKAMQLTNILRDVGEDLDDDRIYLPEEVLQRYDITEDRLRTIDTRIRAGASVPRPYRAAMHELIGRADALYEYARPGFAALPPSFARSAVVAADIYRGIHRQIRLNRYDNFRKRARTSFLQKCVLGGRALVLRPVRRSRSTDAAPRPFHALRKAAMQAASSLLHFTILVSICTMAGGYTTTNATPASGSLAVCPELDDVRSRYIASVDDEEEVGRTQEAISQCDGPIFRAYEGALTTLQGKHAFWPASKLKYVRRGLAVLDEQVRAHPRAVEIRYLRLLSCYFLPGFLGRGWSVEEDLVALAAMLPSAGGHFPPDLFTDMVQFVLERGEPSQEQRIALLDALELESNRPDA